MLLDSQTAAHPHTPRLLAAARLRDAHRALTKARGVWLHSGRRYTPTAASATNRGNKEQPGNSSWPGPSTGSRQAAYRSRRKDAGGQPPLPDGAAAQAGTATSALEEARHADGNRLKRGRQAGRSWQGSPNSRRESSDRQASAKSLRPVQPAQDRAFDSTQAEKQELDTFAQSEWPLSSSRHTARGGRSRGPGGQPPGPAWRRTGQSAAEKATHDQGQKGSGQIAGNSTRQQGGDRDANHAGSGRSQARPAERGQAVAAGDDSSRGDRRRPAWRSSGRNRTSQNPPPGPSQPGNPPLRPDQGAWRLLQVKVPAADDPGKDDYSVHDALHTEVARRLGCPPAALPREALTLVRKSFDARPPRRSGSRPGAQRSGVRSAAGGGDRAVADTTEGSSALEPGKPPTLDAAKWFVYVVDVRAAAALAAGARKLQPRSGELERISDEPTAAVPTLVAPPQPAALVPPVREPIVVVGSGPAGLFAALALAEAGVPCVLLERGQPVEARGRDIGALFVRRKLDPESNLCYGEGGAGTWSDGKLTTRIGRNSDPVRRVLATLVALGAPESILVSGKPHLGTDRLVRILRAIRHHLAALGVSIRFGTRVEGLLVSGGRAAGVRLAGGEELRGAGVVLAVGHSARPLYRHLVAAGVAMSAKPFALGFRVEHPQALIDQMQYGAADAAAVMRGKGRLPVADYRLAAEVREPALPQLARCAPEPDQATQASASHEYYQDAAQAVADRLAPGSAAGSSSTAAGSASVAGRQGGQAGRAGQSGASSGTAATSRGQTSDSEDARASSRGVYSFCMCPGGQVVPTSTVPEELCVNGMSFSRRNSPWANAALVVAVGPSDWAHLEAAHGPLAGVELQAEAEREAARRGGGNFVAPVQRVTDFLAGETSRGALPSSSYRLGVRSAPLHDLYSPAVTAALAAALARFDRHMPGFVCEAGLLHGVETRTSAPVRIEREAETCESISLAGLYPAGEGAGYAGGIVSAAVDGMRVGEAVVCQLLGAADAGVTGSAVLQVSQ